MQQAIGAIEESEYTDYRYRVMVTGSICGSPEGLP
jgi:hypothetical protein